MFCFGMIDGVMISLWESFPLPFFVLVVDSDASVANYW